MQGKFIFKLTVLIWGLTLLWGCTAQMSGDFRLSMKNYDGAIRYYQEAVSENQADWQTREKLGIAYYKTGQFDKAIQELTKVLSQKPGAPDATYYLGMAQLKKGDQDKAVKTINRYHNPEKPIVEKQIKQQLTLLKINNSLQFARQALANEEKLKTLQPDSDSIAVFCFKDLSQDNRFHYFQKALAAMIITDLTQVKSLNIVERLNIRYLLEEMELGTTGVVNKETASRTGRLLGAENLVIGTLESGTALEDTDIASTTQKVIKTPDFEKLMVDTSIASTTQKDIIAAFSLSDDKSKFFQIQKQIVFKILQLFKIKLPLIEKRIIEKYHTKSFKAVIYFGKGLVAQEKGLWKESREFFKKAFKEDPYFYMAVQAYESSPDPSSPSIENLSNMSPDEIGLFIEKNINRSEKRQKMKDNRSAAQVQDSFGSESKGNTNETGGKGNVSVGW